MKFERWFALHKHDAWHHYYFDYSRLKAFAKKGLPLDFVKFSTDFLAELDKVDKFYSKICLRQGGSKDSLDCMNERPGFICADCSQICC